MQKKKRRTSKKLKVASSKVVVFLRVPARVQKRLRARAGAMQITVNRLGIELLAGGLGASNTRKFSNDSRTARARSAGKDSARY